MTFTLTKYIYPLKESILLSQNQNYAIDNPRNEKEIEIITNLLEISFEEEGERNSKEQIFPIGGRLLLGIGYFKKYLKENHKQSYAHIFYENNSQESIIRLIAKSWIIIRFSNDDEFDKIANDNNELFSYIFNQNDSEYVKKFNNLTSYCFVLSNLINSRENYYGESFLALDNAHEIFIQAKNKNIIKAIEKLITVYNSFERDFNYEKWLFWENVKDEIIEKSTHLENLIKQDRIIEKGKKIRLSQKQTPLQKILHIGSLQKTAYEHLEDPKLGLLLLVSIIEYLVTRNPDTNKFNVEDSISKQFKLKCAILIHNQDKKYDLVKLSKELNKIYSQRSDIAHGNYKEETDILEIRQTVILLYKFIKHIINEFLEDKELLEYLKDN